MSRDAKLAIAGGKRLIPSNKFKRFNSIGAQEKAAALKVLRSGILSDYYAAWGERFYGGEYVRKIEKIWGRYVKAKYAVSVNSATSGLNAAIAAIGVNPGDEIIVTPYSMSASAVCPLVHNAIPVFADVEKNTFCLDPKDVRRKITKRTKGIVVVHLFGGPANMGGIMKLAKEYNLKVIEDCAQSPGAVYRGRYTGTIGDIGVFSLNCHKTIQAGEGGLCVTDDAELALRLRLARNHGEAVISKMPQREKDILLKGNIANLFGQNYKMTEIEAAIGIEQIKKLNQLNDKRIRNCSLLSKLLVDIECLKTPQVEDGCKHVFYVYPLRYDKKIYGLKRGVFVKALQAEGVPLAEGYVKPLYLMDIFQSRRVNPALARKGWVNYQRGLCPNAESLHEEELFLIPYYAYDFEKSDIGLIAKAFHKIRDNIGELHG